MTVHAEHALRRSSIAQVLNLLLAATAAEASGAVCLVTRQDSQILNFLSACAAAVRAAIADERAVAQDQEVGIGVEERAARIAAETFDMPSQAG